MENQTACSRHCRHRLCVSKVPIFSELDEQDLQRIASLIVRQSYAAGELILMEGEEANSLIIINSGQVKTFRYTPDGKEQILYIFSEGDFLGEMSLLREHQLSYSAEALQTTNVCILHRERFHELIKEYPEILLNVTAELCARIEKLETMVQRLGSNNVEARISMMLLEFARKYGKKHPKGVIVNLPLSREGMANYIGVTRETVSRKLHALQEAGLIELVGTKQVVILDMGVLERTE